MMPFARYAFTWEEAGGKFYNVVDRDSSVYADGSTISERSVKSLGLPVVASAQDEEQFLRQMNATYSFVRMGL